MLCLSVQFVNLSKDLTLHDLQTVSVPYDVIRAQIVKAYGDGSGRFSEGQLAVQDDEQKEDE